MRTTTRVSVRFESLGKPEHTENHDQITVGQVSITLLKWMTQTYMGHYMRVTIARSSQEIDEILAKGKGKQSESVDDIMAELEGMITQENLEFDNDPEPRLLED